MLAAFRASRFQAAAMEAWWALRIYSGSTLLIIGAGILAVAAALPMASFWSPAEPRLRLASLPTVDLGIPLSRLAWTPSAAQWAALASIGTVVAGLGVAILCVAELTVLTVGATRASARRSEMVVRRAVGASRTGLRLSGGLEGIAMGGAVVIVGVPAGVVAWRWLAGTWPGSIGPERNWLPLALGLTLVAGVLLGAYLPAIWIPHDPQTPRRSAVPHGFVVPALQMGVSLAILVVSATLQRYVSQLTAGSGPGGTGSGVVLEIRQSESLQARAARYASVLHSLTRAPMPETVSLSSAGVLSGVSPVDFITTDCGRCSQGGLRVRFRVVPATLGAISADTFKAMNVRLVQGRVFADGDSWQAPRVAIVNATLAASHFEGGQALGRKILLGSGAGQQWFTVVGVVHDVPAGAVGGVFQPPYAVYVSVLQQPPTAAELLVRGASSGDAAVIGAEAMARAALGGSRSIVARDTEASRRLRATAPLRWFGRVAAGAGLMALVLALLGMYAVMELWTRALVPELAVRRAVGARRLHVAGYVLARAVGVAIGGVALGWWLTVMTSGVVAAAFGVVDGPDAGLIVTTAGLLTVVALVGAWFPAWRAARTAPALALARLDP
jgi:hypothetical protein